MSTIIDSQLHTIQTSFLKILEIGKTNPENATFLVLSILGSLDSMLVPASLKERTIEIVETEGPSSIEASLNEVFEKQFQTPLIPSSFPESLPSEFSTLIFELRSDPKKAEHKESKSNDAPRIIPVKIYEFAKIAGIPEEVLEKRLKLVEIEGRLCAIFLDNHEVPEFIHFKHLLKEAAEKEEIALLRESSFVTQAPKGHHYGLEQEDIYLLSKFIQFCCQNDEGDPDAIKANQIEFLSCIKLCREMYYVLSDIIAMLDRDLYVHKEREALSVSLYLKKLLEQHLELFIAGLSTKDSHEHIKGFKDITSWNVLCNFLLEISKTRLRNKLSPGVLINIEKIFIGKLKPKAEKDVFKKVVIIMRNNIFVKSTVLTLPKIPKDIFLVLHMGELHVSGFLRKLSNKCQVKALN